MRLLVEEEEETNQQVLKKVFPFLDVKYPTYF